MSAIRTIVGWIQKFVDWLNSMDEGTRKVIITIALVAAAIGPVLIIVGKVISAVGTIMTIISKVVVYDPRHVEIRWKFSDEVLKLLQE